MRKLIYEEEVKIRNSKTSKPRYFALLPKIVKEAHPTHKRHHLIWLEWYEKDMGYDWLITNY